jgi:hypothetical protein
MNFNKHLPNMSSSYEYCKTLIKTYNASIIKLFAEPIQESFLTTAKDCLEKHKVDTETGKERTVLATLVSNLDNENVTPTLPNVGFMEGPLNISLHWSQRFQKLIYVLGELHVGTIKCPPKAKESTSKIEDYLTNWFKNPTAYTDFYLEIGGFVMPEGYDGITFGGQENIDILRKQFSTCIDKLTRDKDLNCNTSRMHFFDIRQGNIKGGIPPITIFWRKIANLLTNIEYDPSDSNKISKLQIFCDDNKEYMDTLEKISEYSEQEYKEFWYDQLYNFQIIKKEIDRMDENVRPYLNYFIEQQLNEYINDNMFIIQQLLEDIYIFKNYKWNIEYINVCLNFYDNLNKFLSHCSPIILLFTDAYLLARIFKTFKINDPDLKKRRLVDEPSEPHNIIIYAGLSHSDRYRKFLDDFIGFKTLEKSGKGFNKVYNRLRFHKCIDIKEPNLDGTNTITQPLFNTWPSEKDKFVPFDRLFSAEKLKKYESFEATFNIKPDIGSSDVTIQQDV